MTKREFINDVMENYAGLTDEGREVAERILASLDKKSATPTKRQTENEEIKVKIAEFLTARGPATATEIANAVDISCQRASALLKQMGTPKTKVKGGKVLYGEITATAEAEDEGDE